VTKSLAYDRNSELTAIKRFTTMTVGANVIKHFMAVGS
jgi:hypothetical protein